MSIEPSDGDHDRTGAETVRDRIYRHVNGHPVLSKAASIEVILFSIAVVLALVGNTMPGPGIGLVHMFAGLAVVLMMVVAVTLLVASVLVYAYRGAQFVTERAPV